MRIGIDVYAVQSLSRERGIGRYGRELVKALLATDRGHEFVLYVHPGLPREYVPEDLDGTIRLLPAQPAADGQWGFDALNEIARTNPDDLDVLLMTDMLNPYEPYPDSGPPPLPYRGRPLMACVVYDLIPFLFQERYLREPRYGASFYRRLERVGRYDLLLAISEATRADCQDMLGLGRDRVVSISTGGNGQFFVPDRSEPPPLSTRKALADLGIDAPFVLNLGGMDDRKNLHGLVDAFGLLPEALKRSHQLVIACHINAGYAADLTRQAEKYHAADRLVITGSVSDEVLRILYQRCAAFVFPSHFEGFGLPILEAMHCGAPVVAGNNSSQIEVVGDAGLLVNTRDAVEIASKLARILEDPALAADLSTRGLEQSRRFSWEITANRTLAALEEAQARKESSHRRPRWRRDPAHRSTIAVFSPLPPRPAPYNHDSARLIASLLDHYHVHIYHASGYVPNIGIADNRLACFDHRMFRRMARTVNYQAVLYQTGELDPHSSFVSGTMQSDPGIVTLHAIDEPCDHLHDDTRAVLLTRPEDQEAFLARRPDLSGRVHVVPRPTDPDDRAAWSAVVASYIEFIESTQEGMGDGLTVPPVEKAREGRHEAVVQADRIGDVGRHGAGPKALRAQGG